MINEQTRKLGGLGSLVGGNEESWRYWNWRAATFLGLFLIAVFFVLAFVNGSLGSFFHGSTNNFPVLQEAEEHYPEESSNAFKAYLSRE